jgi:5-methylcytosine-specific restriction endonuclease McrA
MKTCIKCGNEFSVRDCPECSRKRVAAWRERFPDKAKETSARFRADNVEKRRNQTKEWAAEHPDKKRARNHVRRSRIAGSGGRLSADIVEKLMALQKGRCPCCGSVLGNNFHIDHIVPLALGGGNIDSNVQLLRPECNLKKRSKHPVEFMQERGFLI